MLYFSKSTGGFYDSAIHGDDIPGDAVEITVEQHRALLDAQGAGKVIVGDADGNPVSAEPPIEQREVNTRAQRDHLLASTQWMVERHRDQVDGGLPTSITAEQYKGLLAFRQALRDLPHQAGFPDVKMPDPAAYLPAAQ